MSSAIRRGLAAAFLAAALLRCGGGQAAQQDDGWIDVLVVDKPGASHYGAPHTAAPTTVPSALIVRRVQAAAEAAGQSWQQDPALAALAAFVLAQNHKHGSAPTHEVIDFYAAHLGLMEATPHVIRIADPDPVALERSLGADLEQAAREFRYTHVGIAHAKRGGRDEVVVTLSRRGARLSPIPRQVPQGQTLKIQGRLVPPFQQARVLVATPKGGIVTRSTGEDQAIDVQLPLDKRGEHRIELVAQGEHGPTVIANFPIYVGQKPPRRLRRPRRRTASMQSAADVAQGLGTMLNQTRKERGLQVLRQHPRLAVVAKDHSLDMVRSGFIGHGSPTTGSAADRVERTGLRSGLVLENIGRGYDAWQIHRGLMRSPGHRANILNPDVTHFGIGVVERQEGKGRA
ncbi:MAG: CAP domain-containing protein, partial [Polyangiales bacterium]